ncbi:hypothetical protein RHS01_10699 [Rhizoctonia solani]|uniref:Retrotransposable element Tf2 155 kDa protein type 1 n=1 Tax=Rhizoctonia solani TaxID=456999 RepID=A0A8H7I1I1_9AGAM|nr:hypothetical protein RHS01_10699 [Rhizoctonia solani]
MATRSRSSACPQSPLDQRELGPTLPAAATEPTDLEPEVYGEISLSQAISLILDCKTKSSGSSGNSRKPRKQQRKPETGWEQLTKPSLASRLGCAPCCLGRPLQSSPAFAQPTPVRAPPQVHTPPPPSPIRLRSPQVPQPAAPVAAYQTPVKVDHPDAYTGKIGNKARQWLMWMLAWALIQLVNNFRTEFLAAFGNPDATQAAERQITHLTQTGTCAEYITKFRTIAMDLDWNDAALQGQFARGLHWEVSRLIATQERRPTTLLELQNAALVIDNALREERASHPPKGNKSGTSTTTPNRGQVPANRPQDQGASPATPTLSPRRSATAAGLKASASNAPEKQADPLEVLIDSGATSLFLHPHTAELLRLPLIDLPQPRTITMLNGSSPQAGKIWKKAHLTFLFDGKRMTETFLICNTGSHAAILGIKWLEAHNPEINWNSRTLSFPHTPPDHAAIAKEEEADKNPLEGVPPEYHQYAKVFGEEEFNKLPPHRHYNIAIELTEEGPLNSPLYSMTDAESATLKDWLRDELKAGKIRPSKSSISSPVMFVPKKDGSRCLVVDYRRLNNRTKKNVYPLPRPDDLMAQLRGAKVFTKLDLRWGYNNVQVKEGDEWKTAFRTKYGLYKSLVMTFGLTNAPAAFQHFMNKLFKDLLDVCVIIYLDDILIYSKDDATHTQHVHEVLLIFYGLDISCFSIT